MASLKDMRVRIAATKATQKITKAMQMVAASKLRRAQTAAEAARPFAERMDRVLGRIAGSVSDVAAAPKLLSGTGSNRVHLLLVCTGERGLCGPFNSAIVRLARERANTLAAEGKAVATAIPISATRRVPPCIPVSPSERVRRRLHHVAAVRERDRLRTLFDITNALVSKLASDELFSAIGAQLSKLIRHDYSMLTVSNSDNGRLDLYALHSPGLPFIDAFKGPFDPSGMPATEVLATGKPVVARAADIERYPSPIFGKFVALGFRSVCSVPLVAPNRTIGTLALCRMTEDTWSGDDIAFLVQVANQIAIAVENSLSYRELAEMKERLATEKLYLEDEIRLDHNNGNMVGQGLAFQSILKSVQIVAPTDSTVLILGETGTGKELGELRRHLD